LHFYSNRIENSLEINFLLSLRFKFRIRRFTILLQYNYESDFDDLNVISVRVFHKLSNQYV